MSKHEPTELFAIQYLNDAKKFLQDIYAYKNLARQIA
jgi:hypothetical protein